MQRTQHFKRIDCLIFVTSGHTFVNKLDRIEWHPNDYLKARVAGEEAANALFARLQWMTIEPQVILEAGCGPSPMMMALQDRFQNAKVLHLDSSHAMLNQAKETFPHATFLLNPAEQIPLPDHSVDMIFANLLLPFCSAPKLVYREFQRILSPEGLLMFSSFGPDTLKEFTGFNINPLPHCCDMHDIGDELMTYFADPVVEVEHITLCYETHASLIQELLANQMISTQDVPNDLQGFPLEVTYELIYAHAFGQKRKLQSSNTEFKLSVSDLKQSLKAKNT